MLDINEAAKEIYQNAVEHGFWDASQSFPEKLMLMVSELSEALEEYRNGEPILYFVNPIGGSKLITTNIGDINDLVSSKWKPEGMAVEVVDCIIRALDWMVSENIDIEMVMRAKMEYNKNRPHMHGGKKI